MKQFWVYENPVILGYLRTNNYVLYQDRSSAGATGAWAPTDIQQWVPGTRYAGKSRILDLEINIIR